MGTLPDCGHDERYEMEWREVAKKGGQVTHVWFCIACNYESVTRFIAEEDKPSVEDSYQGGM
jgi:hypothetical protein